MPTLQLFHFPFFHLIIPELWDRPASWLCKRVLLHSSHLPVWYLDVMCGLKWSPIHKNSLIRNQKGKPLCSLRLGLKQSLVTTQQGIKCFTNLKRLQDRNHNWLSVSLRDQQLCISSFIVGKCIKIHSLTNRLFLDFFFNFVVIPSKINLLTFYIEDTISKHSGSKTEMYNEVIDGWLKETRIGLITFSM